jgi:hypothetical protein
LQNELRVTFDRVVQQRDERVESTSFAQLEASLRGPDDTG